MQVSAGVRQTVMSPQLIAHVLPGFALMLGGMWVSDSGRRQLSVDQKARIVDAFSKYRVVRLGGVLAVILVFSSRPTLIGPVGCLFAVGLLALGYRRLRQLDLPLEYLRRYVIGAALVIAGVMWLVAPSLLRAA